MYTAEGAKDAELRKRKQEKKTKISFAEDE